MKTADGTWKFVPDPDSECAKALEAMLNELGPAARCYVGTHIEPSDDTQRRLTTEARESCK